jgi:hypothetical protein
LPAENPRERKKLIGSIGSRARSSHATNAAISSTPVASEATTSLLSQPATLPRTRPQTMPSAPPVTSARPGMSSAVSGPWLSRSFVSTKGMAISPIGTLTQKTHCQARPSTTAPPTSGPAGHRDAGDGAEDADRRAAALEAAAKSASPVA